MVDSRRQIYSLLPLTTRPFHHIILVDVTLSICLVLTGAGKGIRTSDLLITSQLLYRLSYTGFNKLGILHYLALSVKHPPSSNASVCSETLILHSDPSSRPPLTVPMSFHPTL